MKAVIPIGAAENAFGFDHKFLPFACATLDSGVNRVGVSELSQSFSGLILCAALRETRKGSGLFSLKNIHTVGDQGQVLIAAFSARKFQLAQASLRLGMKLSSVWRTTLFS